jgi:glycine betaine/proline transport system permease protein
VWAAMNDRVSAFLRPINDTLQTMPIFVFLIPAVMVFLVGEFTALIAVIMYAIVPSIRYTEHGIRNVPAHVVEAARSFGATRRQLLWQVQLPLALPEIMLGLNQTIMMGLAMVIVAALVGARGLGQEVMVALTWADTGYGAVSGLSVALIAIVTDRIIQSWSRRRKAALGMP